MQSMLYIQMTSQKQLHTYKHAGFYLTATVRPELYQTTLCIADPTLQQDVEYTVQSVWGIGFVPCDINLMLHVQITSEQQTSPMQACHYLSHCRVMAQARTFVKTDPW